MAWTVRTREGSLHFTDFAQLEWAFRNGLIAPEDEIRDPGKREWHKAAAHPHLRNVHAKRDVRRPHAAGVLIALAMAFIAFILLVLGFWAPALALAFGVSLHLMRMNRRVLRPTSAMRA